VTDANLDPPQTFSAAQAKFRIFLATQNYPKAICWVMPGDVVADTSHHYGVRKREVEATRYAAQRYSVGLERNFGVKLQRFAPPDRRRLRLSSFPKTTQMRSTT
jgi:hypothetical protein